jgi:hypothetical protein
MNIYFYVGYSFFIGHSLIVGELGEDNFNDFRKNDQTKPNIHYNIVETHCNTSLPYIQQKQNVGAILFALVPAPACHGNDKSTKNCIFAFL